jgi:hypothetical protein
MGISGAVRVLFSILIQSVRILPVQIAHYYLRHLMRIEQVFWRWAPLFRSPP